MANECPKCQTENPDTVKFCGECGTSLEADTVPTKTLETSKEELTTGSTFAGRYQIIEELGKGGMGKVYKAIDTDIKEKIAVKLINPEISAHRKTIERFQNELKFARKIRHKNVCQMYDLNREEGTYYITMEYVDGQDLRGLIRQTGQLAAGTVINLAKQICEGLSEAHKLGVIHRDLKPSNIMIDKEGSARIMDFGIARSLETKGITGEGMMIGTPEYMSPEQVEGKEVDLRSDIYSLGVVLYEMVTGRVPFEGDTPFTIGMKHKSETPKNPKKLNALISDDLDRVILTCLEKNKEMRYQSVEDVRTELEKIEQGLPTTERVEQKKKPLTSREITVQFSLRKLLIPAFVVIAVLAAGLIIWSPWIPEESSSITADKPSLAVLPFYDLSPQKDQEYFCDGIAAELINRLTKIEELNVPAQASSFSFRGRNLDVQEIGEKLKVKSVLAGSLQKAGDRLRITVELVKVSDGYPLWSGKYERNMEDIFALQDEISLSIVENLKIKLLGEEKTELVTHHTENPEAYNLYLKGRYSWNKRTEEGLKEAVEFFEHAIEKDPNYAMAYVGLADSYFVLPDYTSILPKDVYPKAEDAATRALEIDDSLAEAYTTLASIKRENWEWESSESGYKRSIELNPRYSTAHHWYALFLMFMARFDEAIKEIKLALELDPFSLVINRNVGQVCFFARRYEQAIEALKRTIEMSPNFPYAHNFLGRVYAQKSMYKEALAEFQIEKNLNSLTWIGITYVRMKMKDKAKDVLENLLMGSYKPNEISYYIARVYFALEEMDQGFEWLEKAYDKHDNSLVYLKIDPAFDSVRSDPRFKALLKRMNLE